ncbi:MAG: hypothetical protein KGD65_10710, partial [Candidatus Lokiarchaeota archaeon]|nr:hypothetical protein [Candidatus Lokiarchaeota archaeon]
MRLKSFKNSFLDLSILLIVLCFAAGFIYNPFNDKLLKSQDDTFNNIFGPETSVIQPNGKPLTVYQYANISNSYSDSDLPLNVSFTLAQDWTSKNITIYYDGVSQKKDRVVNGDFDSDISEWTYISNAPEEYVNRGWDASGNPDGSMVIKTSTGQKLEGEYGYFEQTISIPEGLGKKDASFTFDYFYNNGFLNFYNVNVYMAIIVGDVEKNKTIDLQYISRLYWDSLSMEYNPSDFGQELPGNLSFRIGFYTSDDTSVSNWGDFQIDNVEFTLWTEPSQEGLIRAYDNEFNQNHTYYNTTYGKGYSFLDSERIRSPSDDVIISLYQNISDVLDFSVDNIYILSTSVKVLNSTFSGSDGCFYTLGEQIEWQTEFSVSIPPNYVSWLEVVKPSNWNFTSIKDGYEDEQVEFCVGTEGSVKMVIIPNDIVSLGLWKLKAISENYIINGNLEVMEDDQFKNSSSLTFGNIFRVSVSLNNSVSYNNTLVNCSIYYSNHTILWGEEKEPDSSEIDFGNFTVGLNMTVGQYQVKIFWSNNESSLNRDQIGYTQFKFDVWHTPNLTAIDSYFEMIAGDPLLLKVKLSDCCTNKTIDFATINYNSTYGIYGTMTYQGLGIYLAELDTSSLELGNYYFSFNTSKEYYKELFLNDLINLKIIAQPIVLETPHSVINSMANDYAICQVNVTGGHSGTLIWPANISTDWQNPYSVVEHFNGTYTLNFSTYNLPTLGIVETYTISIYANKTNYGSSNGFVTITIQPIQTLVNVNDTIITTEINKNFELIVNYTTEDSGDLILEAICSVSWPGSYNVTNLLCDCFIIEFNTEGLNIDTYTSIIKLEKAGYQ